MSSEKYSFVITDKANTDLDEIVRYISIELANPDAASGFIDHFLEMVDNVCSFPESGSLVNNVFLPDSSVRHKVIGNYVMYYLPDDDLRACIVLRVIYGGRDLEGILKQAKTEE